MRPGEIAGPGRLRAVESDEFGHVSAGRQLDQSLVEAEQKILDLGGLVSGC